MHIGQFPPVYHLALETLAFWIAFRLYLMLKKRDSLNRQKRIPIVFAGIVGAAIGSKLLFWLEDPATVLQHITDIKLLTEGKSLVGALLGGWVGIEIAKKLSKVKSSTGDSFVLPLSVGMLVGRIGCLLCGGFDHTYGVATNVPWGMDFGDGVQRHPTQAYEIAFLLGFVIAWTRLTKMKLEQGEMWKIFILSYMTFRFLVEFIKPVPHVYLGLDIEQVCALGVYAYYAPYLISKFRRPREEQPDATA